MNGRGGALLVLALVGCSTESTRVREARDEFYTAISRYDQGAIRALVVGDYLAVDRGRLFNLDSLISDVIMLEQESLAVRYAFADSALRIDPPLAVVVYHSRRIAERARSTDTAFAVETATFRREGSGWKLVVLHRTPTPATPEYFPAETTRPPASAKTSAGTASQPTSAPRPVAPKPNPAPAQTQPAQNQPAQAQPPQAQPTPVQPQAQVPAPDPGPPPDQTPSPAP